MRVLVAGASGYVGSRLVPSLLDAGFTVRAASSSGRTDAPWAADVEAVTMDAHDPDQVRRATRRIDAVVYLVHGLAAAGFQHTDRLAAAHMTRAVAANGVQRVVYLSGLVPVVAADQLSEHILSRLEVEEILSCAPAPTTALRAAIVLGSGSTSYEIMRQLSHRLPVQALPRWSGSLVQPIALVDVLACIVGALQAQDPASHYDIGGPERLTYADLLRTYRAVAGIRRPQLPLRFVPTSVVGRVAGLITDLPNATVHALVESLHHDMVCSDDRFTRDLLPPDYRLVTVRRAIERSVRSAAERPDPMATTTARC